MSYVGPYAIFTDAELERIRQLTLMQSTAQDGEIRRKIEATQTTMSQDFRMEPHKYVPYPKDHAKHGSCVKCGRVEAHSSHVK